MKKEFLDYEWDRLPLTFKYLLTIKYSLPNGRYEAICSEVSVRTANHILSMPVERLVNVCCYLLDKKNIAYNKASLANLVKKHKLKAVKHFGITKISVIGKSMDRFHLTDVDTTDVYEIDLFSDDKFIISRIVEKVENLKLECADDCIGTIEDNVILDYLHTRGML